MKSTSRVRGVVAPLLAVIALMLAESSATACSSCFGDPGSNMAKGAVAGVWFMVGMVGVVLFGIAGTGLFWLQRSRRLSRIHPSEFDSTHAQ